MTQQITPSPTPTPPPAPAEPSPHVTVIPGQSGGFLGWLKRVFAFIGWVFSGFGLIGALRRRAGGTKSEEIVVYTVHRSFYLWGLILTGFIGSFCVRHWTQGHGVWGWVYIFVILYTIISLLFDVSTMKALLWAGIFALVWITSRYLQEVRGWVVLSAVQRYLSGLHPQLDPGMASVLSWLMLIPWVGSLFHSFTRGRKTFSPNSIEEWFMGEGREILDRTGLKFRTRYRDLFETFLGLGAGDVEAINNHQDVVKKWDNILFLAFLWPRLDEILHQRSAVVDNAPSNPVEVEEVKKM